MKAMVLTGPGELVRDDVARPGPEQGQLLVRVTHSGICGTDYKIFNGAIPVSYPRIMGHEMAGEVVEPGASMLRSGDRVIVDPRALLPDLLSLPDRPDASVHERHARRSRPRRRLRRVRDRAGQPRVSASGVCRDTHAPLIQVLTTCLHAQRQIDIFPGEFVVVLGLGVTGQLHVQLAKARGATSSASPAAPTSARWRKRSAPTSRFLAATMPSSGCARPPKDAAPTSIIETTGVVPSLSSAIDMARSGGRLLLFGIITAKEGALPFYDLYFKELAAHQRARRQERGLPGAIGLVQRGQVRARAARQRRHAARGAQDGHRHARVRQRRQRMKIILDHGGIHRLAERGV